MPRRPATRRALASSGRIYSIKITFGDDIYARLKFVGDIVVHIELNADLVQARFRLSKRQLIDAFQNQRMSLATLQVLTGISRMTIGRRLRSWGLDTSVWPEFREPVDLADYADED